MPRKSDVTSLGRYRFPVDVLASSARLRRVMPSRLFKSNVPCRPASLPIRYGAVVANAGATGTVASIPGQTIGVNVFNDELRQSVELYLRVKMLTMERLEGSLR